MFQFLSGDNWATAYGASMQEKRARLTEPDAPGSQAQVCAPGFSGSCFQGCRFSDL